MLLFFWSQELLVELYQGNLLWDILDDSSLKKKKITTLLSKRYEIQIIFINGSQ